MQNQGDFKLCASSADVVKRFAVIKECRYKEGPLHVFGRKLLDEKVVNVFFFDYKSPRHYELSVPYTIHDK